MHGLSNAYLTQNSDFKLQIDGNLKKIRDVTLPGGGSMGTYGCLIISLWNLYARELFLGYDEFPRWWDMVKAAMTGNYLSSALLVKPTLQRYGVMLNMMSFPLCQYNYFTLSFKVKTADRPYVFFSHMALNNASFSESGLHHAKTPDIANGYFREVANIVVEIIGDNLTARLGDVVISTKIHSVITSFNLFKNVKDLLSSLGALWEYPIVPSDYVDLRSVDGHAIFKESTQPSGDFGVPTVDPLDFQDIHGKVQPKRVYYRHYPQVIYYLSKSKYFLS